MKATHYLRGGALALSVAAGALAGCGGGSMPSHGVGSGNGDSGSSGSSKYAVAKLTIVIPEKTTSGMRRPAYISASTAWLAWTLDGAQQNPVALSTTASPNPNCTGSGSSTVCTVPFYVAPGTHNFVFTLEDANFRALSTGTATNVTLTAGVANTLNLTLGGIPAGISVSSNNTNFTKSSSIYTMYGTGSVTLAINAVDAAGNTIVGGGAPSLSASLAAASPAPSPAPSATLVAGSGNTWTLTSSFQPSSPTQGTAAVLKVQASPAAGSGIASFSSQFSVLFYTPRIFVAQSGSGSVTSYDEQGNAQSTTITGLAAPQAVSYGANSSTPNPLPSSYLYVGSLHVVTPTPLPTANATAGPTPTPYGSIAAYNIDGSSPSGLGAFSNAGVPVGVAFDTNLNELFALNSIGSALQVYSSSGTYQSTAVASIINPTGIAFDAASNDMYVSTSSSVIAYHENGSADTAVSSFSSLNSPAGIAYDSVLNELFVLNRGNSTVAVYSPSGGAPLASFSVVSTPTALMYDPYVRWIYVANATSIRAYSESGAPQTLSGTWSNLSTPTSLTVVQ